MPLTSRSFLRAPCRYSNRGASGGAGVMIVLLVLALYAAAGVARAISDSSAVRSANEERETLPVTSDKKRGAADCTAAQAVAAAHRASGMGNTVMASGPRPRLRSGGKGGSTAGPSH